MRMDVLRIALLHGITHVVLVQHLHYQAFCLFNTSPLSKEKLYFGAVSMTGQSYNCIYDKRASHPK